MGTGTPPASRTPKKAKKKSSPVGSINETVSPGPKPRAVKPEATAQAPAQQLSVSDEVWALIFAVEVNVAALAGSRSA